MLCMALGFMVMTWNGTQETDVSLIIHVVIDKRKIDYTLLKGTSTSLSVLRH